MIVSKKIISVIRIIIIFLFTLVLAGLSIKFLAEERHVIFLVDESRSIDAESHKFVQKFLRDSFNTNKKFTYSLISFARHPQLFEFAQRKSSRFSIRNRAETKNESGWIDETNIAAAVKLAESLKLPNIYSTEIVLISDGNETAGNAAEIAAYCEIPISTVPIPKSNLPEVLISEFNVPLELKAGEPFNIDLTIYSNRSAKTDISIYRNEFKIHSVSEQLSDGENKFRFYQVASEDRTQEFKVRIEPVVDTVKDNNFSSKIAIAGEQARILMIDSEPEVLSDFVSAMSEQGIKIVLRPAEGIPKTADGFTQFDAVIISDISVSEFSLQQMNLIRDYVYEFGGGFIMIGGEHAFGLGGYYKTIIEDILPVRCNFDDEKEKNSIAVSLVIDRSGSMNGDKIKIAKESAKEVVELLSENDYISIIAYDVIPHVIIPTQKVTNVPAIRTAINGLTPGGGTSIYPAVQESYNQLNWLDTSTKHVILLTDGKSEMDNFDLLMKRIIMSGISVTIISIGDSEDELLRRFAEMCNGRFYQVSDINSVPQIFASETKLSRVSPLSEIPFVPIIVTKNAILNGILSEQIPPLLGFVRTKSKSVSRTILASGSGEPLLSWRRYGIGMTAAFTSDVKNRWAAEWIMWNDFAKLWAQIIRFVMKRQVSDNAIIESKYVDGKIEVTVDITDTNENFINGAGGFLTIITPDLLKRKIEFDQIASGRYKAKFNANVRGNYQLQMRLQSKEQQTILDRMTIIAVDNSSELRNGGVNEEILQRIAKLTGGNYNPEPSNLLLKRYKPISKRVSLRPYLFVVIILLFLIDLFLRRKKNI
ncbi:MAG: VWA domain-containing protein [Planctomycetaceae bacterium]|nr:VWA domain-containing protein [Planctomycetaceae bacterium]